jgi:cytochrome c oxidase assembly protein subunit 15
MMKLFDRLVLAAVLLTFCVVVLGAYVRLSDAGLGCPDWPGCYGHLTVPQTDIALEHARQAYPDKPLETHKAWKEMVHRYFAGTLGLLILAIFIMAWRNRKSLNFPIALPAGILMLVVFQALLGMWTVTLLLKPVIVSAHLLGGMTTLALLAWVAHRRWGEAVSMENLHLWARLGLVVLALQIFLGGWTSSNYAALACTDFPVCQGGWLPEMDFSNAFHMIRELGQTADGSQLSLAALTAIHWSHRLGALVTLLYLGWLSARVMRNQGTQWLGSLMAGLLVVQVGLGISNVLFSLPLPVAVAHNAVAALLLISLVVLNSKITGMSGKGSVL